MKNFLFLLTLLSSGFVHGQVVTTDPAFPVANQPVTITVDVSGTSLDHLAWDNTTNPVYIWTWINKSGVTDVDAPTNVNPATAAAAAAKCTRISTNPDKYQITFTPTTFFNKSVAELPRIGLKLKTKDWAENKQTDVNKFIDFVSGFNASFEQPTQSSLLKNIGDQFDIIVNASESSVFTLKIGGNTVSTQSGLTKLTYNHTVAETSGTTNVVCEVVAGTQSKTLSFSYTIRSATVNQARPAGIIDGINYSADATKATLGLWAPGNTSVYVLGDFNNWDLSSSYQMKKDGEHFWIEISGLTSGTEYAFQYLVDETIYVADPYADKILDGDNDQYIPAATYPSLKAYPEKARSDKWYFNKVSVLQTNQTPYEWQVTDFEKPAKENLVVYELLVRDYFADGQRNYQNLIDTISYIKKMGVTAIELMPIMEFAGNDSWGYNPVFMFTPDKYYGTKNKFKEFIDVCHQNGIAVILDITMNHQDMPNPYLMMDFNYTTLKPNPTNKWFNVDATHPFSVFFDMNHESLYTKAYLDTINYHWLNEYKVDGYRYDLSKGFTQTNNPNNVGAWGNYDASRIAILKRMADKVWQHTPEAIIILEHFAANTEEKELSEYRMAEGKGMMLWGNHNHAYAQSTMGFASDSDFSGIFYGNRGWSKPHLVGYMESHDEERLMYKNLQFGSSSGSYNVKTLATALRRVEAASTIFYTIPGPKMLWQFGELGYDISIDENGRTGTKPVKWDYLTDPNRKRLLTHTSDLIRLKNTYSIFNRGAATFSGMSTLTKQVALKNNPYTEAPTSADAMNAEVVVNFDVTQKSIAVNFPHTGTWYDYYGFGLPLEVTTLPFSITLTAGEYKLYTDFLIDNPIITATEREVNKKITLYPNPVNDVLAIELESEIISDLQLRTLEGRTIRPEQISKNHWNVSTLPQGLYIAEIKTRGNTYRVKVIKK
ncbi:MAG TPA: alpha-amylase family glycosyl hydrolase [Chryseolinea sp.]|nr:alpha-amylase family glycosyl hydrolase [Chryseolinea sp.]HPM32295.1 alpha-amylase family glycosyl hydrolase [Chryseolinea sp.]